LWAVALALVLCVISGELTIKLYSPLLAATLILTIATIALIIRDLRTPPRPVG
jgi:hypothetical protein